MGANPPLQWEQSSSRSPTASCLHACALAPEPCPMWESEQRLLLSPHPAQLSLQLPHRSLLGPPCSALPVACGGGRTFHAKSTFAVLLIPLEPVSSSVPRSGTCTYPVSGNTLASLMRTEGNIIGRGVDLTQLWVYTSGIAHSLTLFVSQVPCIWLVISGLGSHPRPAINMEP